DAAVTDDQQQEADEGCGAPFARRGQALPAQALPDEHDEPRGRETRADDEERRESGDHHFDREISGAPDDVERREAGGDRRRVRRGPRRRAGPGIRQGTLRRTIQRTRAGARNRAHRLLRNATMPPPSPQRVGASTIRIWEGPAAVMNSLATPPMQIEAPPFGSASASL